jgi:hypothetical protein
MSKGFAAILGALIVFVGVVYVITSVITGTDTGSTIIKALLGLVCAFGVIMTALRVFMTKGD